MRNRLCQMLLTLFFWLCFSVIAGKALEMKNVVFVIISQRSPHHEEKAIRLKEDISQQTKHESMVYLTHEDFHHFGDWIVLPLLPILWEKQEGKCAWLFFCTEDTKVNVLKLLKVFESFKEEEIFLGHGLSDKEPTIIHHFSSLPNFNYPLFASGFAISHKLFERLKETLSNEKLLSNMDFSIDASHELALFVRNYADGPFLTLSSHFCVHHSEECATWVDSSDSCDKTMDISKIFFAVKTCKKFHKDRVPVVQKTWGSRALHIAYFSNVKDENIPTVKLNVANTKHGHCSKTSAIIKYIKKQMDEDKKLEWGVIADDDTIFSVYRVQQLLSCYDSSHPCAIGERYGYNLQSENGYNYITGGGGIVLSKAAVFKFWKAEKMCSCPSGSTPDDMFLLGVCLHRLNITLVHLPRFHQARPNDYSEDYIAVGPPISFHKHWMVNPIQIYKDWFQNADLLNDKQIHVEL